MLAPGGVMALTDGLAAGRLLRVGFRLAGTRERVHTPAELDALLVAQGLEPVGRGVLPRMGGSVQVVVSRRVAGA